MHVAASAAVAAEPRRAKPLERVSQRRRGNSQASVERKANADALPELPGSRAITEPQTEVVGTSAERSLYSSGQNSRSWNSIGRGVGCDAASPTGTRMANMICGLRRGWGSAVRWLSNLGTLTNASVSAPAAELVLKVVWAAFSPLTAVVKTALEASSTLNVARKNRVHTEF